MEKDINKRKFILLVDDDEVHLSITELALKDYYEIHMVKSGKEALKFLSENHTIPDLMLLDILMPEMDGWVLFDKINDIAALRQTPIIFYTSMNEESAKEKSYELGAVDYITKPCETSVLLNRIGLAIQQAELKKWQHGIK